MTLGKSFTLNEGGGLDYLEEPFQLLKIDPSNWRSLQGIGNREKGNVFSFLFLFWLCLNMNVISKRFRRACALEDLY